MIKYQIIPSIIAHSQQELEERISKLKKHSKCIHLDIMDGQFVKHTSIEFDFKIPKTIKTEAHLMLASPAPWLIHNNKKISCVIAHYNSETHMHDFIKLAKKYKLKVGVAINPEVPAEAITQYLKLIDKVHIMTVHPGNYGSPFLPETLNKIKYLRGLNPKMNIEVDGGIMPNTLNLCKQAGANQFVVGSYLQKSKNIKSAWKELNNLIK